MRDYGRYGHSSFQSWSSELNKRLPSSFRPCCTGCSFRSLSVIESVPPVPVAAVPVGDDHHLSQYPRMSLQSLRATRLADGRNVAKPNFPVIICSLHSFALPRRECVWNVGPFSTEGGWLTGGQPPPHHSCPLLVPLPLGKYHLLPFPGFPICTSLRWSHFRV